MQEALGTLTESHIKIPPRSQLRTSPPELVREASAAMRPSHHSPWTPDRIADALAIVMLLALTLIAGLTFRDYGLGWDDYTHSEYGDLLLSLYGSGFTDTRALSFVNLYYYGGGFDMLAALAAKISPFTLFETRRLMGAAVGILGLAVTWRIGRRIGGPEHSDETHRHEKKRRPEKNQRDASKRRKHGEQNQRPASTECIHPITDPSRGRRASCESRGDHRSDPCRRKPVSRQINCQHDS